MRGLLTLAFAALAAAKAIPYVGNNADVSNHDIVKNENNYDSVIRRHDKHTNKNYDLKALLEPPSDGLGGEVKKITVNISETRQSLDGGNERFHYAMNGQPYGNPVIINEGEEVEFIIDNFSNTPTTIHLHGFLQSLTPWADGVPGVTQSIIPPNKQYIYRTRLINQHGLYWGHSHLRELYTDGIVFPIYVRPSPDRIKPFDLLTDDTQQIADIDAMNNDPIIVALTDYKFLPSSTTRVTEFDWQFGLLCFDSILVNNVGRRNCPNVETLRELTASNTTTAKGCLNPNVVTNSTEFFEPDVWFNCEETDTAPQVFDLDYEKGWAVFHFLNNADHWSFLVSIDEHEMYTFEADGNFHEPLQNNGFQLGVSNRIGVAVKLDKPGEYVMRIAASNEPQIISAYAIIRYGLDQNPTVTYSQEPGFPSLPQSSPWIDYAGRAISNETNLMDNLALRSFPRALVPKAYEDADVFLRLDLNASGTLLWGLGGQFYDPLLEMSQPPVLTHPDYYEALNKSISTYPKDSVVDLVHVTIPGNPAHPIHKHFEHAWVMGGGIGPFNYTSITEAEAAGLPIQWDSPPLRDGWLTFAAPNNDTAWFIVRYKAETAAAVLLHCHIEPHRAGGMAWVMNQGPEDYPELPDYYEYRANGWAPYTPLPFGSNDLSIPAITESV